MRLFILGLLLWTNAWAQSRVAPRRWPEPPPLNREMRAVWVASVGNIDWPSKPGLPVAQQQAELRSLLDLALRINLNTVILQVRPGCDALYASPLEPWSEYLTGRMGQAPAPFWDPLRFACDEAHARGLELHAWFNPFRARHNQVVGPISPNHITQQHPDWMVSYGPYRWLDPGLKEARDHVQQVALDIVRRYDIDGLHFDDYFYPYPIRGAEGIYLPFSDQASYARYQKSGGKLDREEWRRSNINTFVESLYASVHRIKPWVKVGISPFGIWRPDNPPGIKGLDQYGLLYADARLWLSSGWCDYISPQLYWPTAKQEQSFQKLLHWWEAQNGQSRLMVPGLNSAKIGDDRPASDIANQIRITRQEQGEGVAFWNASSLRNNLGGISAGLTRELFANRVLTPPTPWLGAYTPESPKLQSNLNSRKTQLSLTWETTTNTITRSWVVRSRYGTQWDTQILGAGIRSREYDRRRGQVIPDEVRISPVGVTGSLGEAATWSRP